MKNKNTTKATAQDYEAYKRYLQSLDLTYQEYEKKIREWIEKNGY